MQRHVRAMLHRLRPASPVDAGLTPALDSLVAFWRARQPAIDFTLEVTINEDGSAIRCWRRSIAWCRKA